MSTLAPRLLALFLPGLGFRFGCGCRFGRKGLDQRALLGRDERRDFLAQLNQPLSPRRVGEAVGERALPRFLGRCSGLGGVSGASARRVFSRYLGFGDVVVARPSHRWSRASSCRTWCGRWCCQRRNGWSGATVTPFTYGSIPFGWCTPNPG